MAIAKQLSEEEKIQVIEDIFQETLAKLKAFHNEKLELIKKFRAENNLTELNKIRGSLKEQL